MFYVKLLKMPGYNSDPHVKDKTLETIETPWVLYITPFIYSGILCLFSFLFFFVEDKELRIIDFYVLNKCKKLSPQYTKLCSLWYIYHHCGLSPNSRRKSRDGEGCRRGVLKYYEKGTSVDCKRVNIFLIENFVKIKVTRHSTPD